MKNKFASILFLSFVLIYTSCNSRSGNRKANLQNEQCDTGKIIGVLDGDTYDILLAGNQTIRIRMEGIDAPEKGMPFYQKSKKYLSDMCFNKKIKLVITGVDSHGRKLAFGYLADGRELSHEMIKAGLAWHYKKFNSDLDLAQLEVEARMAKIGIWSTNNEPMPPWENRELHRNGISTKDSFDIKQDQY